MRNKIFLSLLLAVGFIRGQNLLVNSSFELGNISQADCSTQSWSTNIFSNLASWQSRYFYNSCGPGWPSHSPDWFYSHGSCPAWDGNGKIGIMAYELADEDFGERLVDQECYTVRLKINSAYSGSFHDWDRFRVNIYLSRGLVFYEDPDIVDNGDCHDTPCDHDYCHYIQVFPYDDLVKIVSFDISPVDIAKDDYAAAHNLNYIENGWYDFIDEFKADFLYDAHFYSRFIIDIKDINGSGGPASQFFLNYFDFAELFTRCPNHYELDGVRLAGSQTKYECQKSIVAGNISKGNVIAQSTANSKFQAGNVIELIPGFQTEWGAVLDAHIQDCSACHLLPPDGRMANPAESLSKDQLIRTVFSVYPTPAESFVEVESQLPIKNIEIMNTDGKSLLLQAGNGTNMQVNIGNLSPGLYLLKAQMTDGSVQTEKVIKVE
jgi:hypothetical protein